MTDINSKSRDDTTSSSKSSGNGNGKKPPTLSDIAARMKLEGKDKDSSSKDKESAGSGSGSEVRPRLGLTGRLNTSGSAGVETNEASSAQSPKTQEAILAGTDNNMVRTGSSSRSSSPDKSRSKTGKGLPSLEEIRERMSKKTFSKDGSSIDSKSPTATETKVGDSTNGKASSSPSFGNKALPTTSTAGGLAPALKTTPPKASGLAAAADISSSSSKTSTSSSSQPAMPAVRIIGEKPSNEQIKKAANPANPREMIGEDGKKLHPLQHKWTLYFDSKSFNPSNSAQSTPASTPRIDGSPLPPSSTATPPATDSYEAALKKLGVYNSVESFFATYTTLRRPSTLDKSSNYHLFKDGIKPMWEDPANENGGKWTVLFKGTNPALLDRSWMWLVLALVGEELDENNDITGAVCSTRPKGDRISLWLRNKHDVDLVNKLGRKLAHLLDVEKEPGVSLDFSFHSGNHYGANGGTGSKFITFHNNPSMPTLQTHQSYGASSSTSSPQVGSTQGRPNFGVRRGSEQSVGGMGMNSGIHNQRSPQPNNVGGGLGMSLGIGRSGPIGRSSSPVGGHAPSSSSSGGPPSMNRLNSNQGFGNSKEQFTAPKEDESGGSGGLSGGVSLGMGRK